MGSATWRAKPPGKGGYMKRVCIDPCLLLHVEIPALYETELKTLAVLGFIQPGPWWFSGKESACQWRISGFDP